jgi:hypothetical protein
VKLKESVISDMLHRFWKKEHDSGCENWMELSKLHFVLAVLTIKLKFKLLGMCFLQLFSFHFLLWISFCSYSLPLGYSWS